MVRFSQVTYPSKPPDTAAGSHSFSGGIAIIAEWQIPATQCLQPFTLLFPSSFSLFRVQRLLQSVLLCHHCLLNLTLNIALFKSLNVSQYVIITWNSGFSSSTYIPSINIAPAEKWLELPLPAVLTPAGSHPVSVCFCPETCVLCFPPASELFVLLHTLDSML